MNQLSRLEKQILSVLFTVIVYSIIFNWQLALIICIGIGFHEMSHLWMAQRKGYPTGGFYLIPFVGGMAFVCSWYKSYKDQAMVALAGPIGGGWLAILTAGLYWITGWSWLAATAMWMVYVNLFNLLPMSFMDGGQVMGTLTYSINRTVGMVAHVISSVLATVLITYLTFPSPILAVFITYLSAKNVWAEVSNWRNMRDGKLHLVPENYIHPPKKLNGRQALAVGGVWALSFGLLTALYILLSKTSDSNFLSLFHI